MILLEAALAYHKRGYSIFPCKMVTPEEVEAVRQREGDNAAEKFIKKNAKTPRVQSWKPYQNKRATEAEIRRWFTDCGPLKTAISIVTGKISGLTVVDIDDPELIPEIRAKGLGDPKAVRTGRGVHLYYSYDPRLKTCSGFRGIEGLDIRNDGGYIIAPPSPHYSGVAYKFLNSESESFELQPPPDWLFDSAKAGEKSTADFFTLATPPQQIDLNRLRSALAAIPAKPYDDWLRVGMALHHDLGADGLQIWIDWSKTADNFDEGACRDKWGTFHG